MSLLPIYQVALLILDFLDNPTRIELDYEWLYYHLVFFYIKHYNFQKDYTGTVPDYYLHSSRTMDAQPLSALSGFRTTELFAEIRYAPGETYVNTKQGRTTVNLDAPVFTFGHTIGFKGVLGGDHDFHVSEAVIYKRFWLSAGWGKVDCRLRGTLQWNSVPYMLLLMPEANLSYVLSENTFSPTAMSRL